LEAIVSVLGVIEGVVISLDKSNGLMWLLDALTEASASQGHAVRGQLPRLCL
jgi:hypothetical protein